jgi:hypothetical protein
MATPEVYPDSSDGPACEQCGKSLRGSRGKRFCSPACGYDFVRREQVAHDCLACGKPLVRKQYGATMECLRDFNGRQYCDRSCAAAFLRGKRHHNWKGETARPNSHRARARENYVLPALCQECGVAPATQRHHRDGHTANNEPDNIAFVCSRCHMTIDGRLDAFSQRLATAWSPRREPQDPKPCAECGQPSKPLTRGLCKRCYGRRYRQSRARQKAQKDQ